MYTLYRTGQVQRKIKELCIAVRCSPHTKAGKLVKLGKTLPVHLSAEASDWLVVAAKGLLTGGELK